MSPLPTPHAPLGASASFHLGPAGVNAGFALPANSAGAQNVVIGCRSSRSDQWSLLPFFAPPAEGPHPLPKGRFGRFLGWAGDKWMIGPLVFKLATPFTPTWATGQEKFYYAPVVCGYLEYDNTHSAEAAELVFGVDGGAEEQVADGLVGFSFLGSHGFATTAHDEVSARTGVAVFGTNFAGLSALLFSVPPHAKRIFPLVLGFYQPGFYYGRWFDSLGAVLAHGVAEHANYLALADSRDAEFMRNSLAFDVKTRAAHAVRVWLAQTRRLAGESEVDLTELRALHQAMVG